MLLERYSTGSSTIGYVMKGKNDTTTMTKCKQSRWLSILVAEYLAISEALMVTIQMKLQRVIIESNS